ncbi:MAG: DUF3305 domain-containing protein [Alphaproteobacteria bacterium]
MEERIQVGVVVERRRAASAWIDHVWRPVAVLPGVPDAVPWTSLGGADGIEHFFAGAATVVLHRTETGNYRDNLASGRPALWVALRATGADPPYDILAVTADPAEGEAMTEAGSDLVEAVPMPDDLRAGIAAYVAAHHVEQPFFKRKRDRANPEALGRRSRVEEDE